MMKTPRPPPHPPAAWSAGRAAIALAAIVRLTLAGCSSGSPGAGGSSSPPTPSGLAHRVDIHDGSGGGLPVGLLLGGSGGLLVGIHGVGQPRNRRELSTGVIRIGRRHTGHPRLVRRGQEDLAGLRELVRDHREDPRPGRRGRDGSKLVLTKDHPLGDVVFGIDNTFASQRGRRRVFAPYTSPEAAGGLRRLRLRHAAIA